MTAPLLEALQGLGLPESSLSELKDGLDYINTQKRTGRFNGFKDLVTGRLNPGASVSDDFMTGLFDELEAGGYQTNPTDDTARSALLSTVQEMNLALNREIVNKQREIEEDKVRREKDQLEMTKQLNEIRAQLQAMQFRDNDPGNDPELSEPNPPVPPPDMGASPMPPPDMGASPVPPPDMGTPPMPPPDMGAPPMPLPDMGASPVPPLEGEVSDQRFKKDLEVAVDMPDEEQALVAIKKVIRDKTDRMPELTDEEIRQFTQETMDRIMGLEEDQNVAMSDEALTEEERQDLLNLLDDMESGEDLDEFVEKENEGAVFNEDTEPDDIEEELVSETAAPKSALSKLSAKKAKEGKDLVASEAMMDLNFSPEDLAGLFQLMQLDKTRIPEWLGSLDPQKAALLGPKMDQVLALIPDEPPEEEWMSGKTLPGKAELARSALAADLAKEGQLVDIPAEGDPGTVVDLEEYPGLESLSAIKWKD